MVNSDISCMFGEDTTLMLSQNSEHTIVAETLPDDDLNDGHFQSPFYIFHPDNNSAYQNLFPFFLRLLKQEHTPNESNNLIMPRRNEGQIHILSQETGHGEYSELRLQFSRNGLIGIAAGTGGNIDMSVWVSPLQDDITQEMRASVIANTAKSSNAVPHQRPG